MNLRVFHQKFKPFSGAILMVVSGFFCCLLIDSQTACEKLDSYPAWSQQENLVDYTGMETLLREAASAFESGDTTQVAQVMALRAWEYYGSQLNGQPVDQMKAYGAALKEAELRSAGRLIAEYALTIAGESYTVTLGKVTEDDWKIVRF